MNWLERKLLASSLDMDEAEVGIKHFSANIAGESELLC
jgi:hypothetical protein